MTSKIWKIGELLKVTAEYLATKTDIENPRLNAEVLLAHLLGVDRVALYLNYDLPLTPAEVGGYRHLIKRRLNREPMQYITGIQEFWSLEFQINPHVLIPRPETELLVEQALPRLKEKQWPPERPPRVLDLGTGSGNIAISVAKEMPNAVFWATDISAEALKVARMNAEKHGVRENISFRSGDLWMPIQKEAMTFDVILSNAPYIATDAYDLLPPEVRDFEPRIALDGGEKGLTLIAAIIAEAPRYLNPGGWILLEMDPEQTDWALRLMDKVGGYASKSRIKDYFHRYRAVIAQNA
jgi:release factor glutamine methyltransferase